MANNANNAPQQLTSSAEEAVSTPYWCHHCNKCVSVETLTDISDVICHECKSGFVESIASAPSISDQSDQPSLNNQFLQVLNMMSHVAMEDADYAPPPPHPPSNLADLEEFDHLRLLDGWNNAGDEEDGEDDDGQEEDGSEEEDNEESENESEEEEEDNRRSEEEEEDNRRRERDVVRQRLRDFTNRRHRILNWTEILMGLQNQIIQFPLQLPEIDGYVGNPGDYVDAAGFEALLQNLAEVDGGGRKGAPPASKSSIDALQRIEITSQLESEVCAICKDSLTVGEIGKKLPCTHVYHEDCIIPWLGSRNSCPVCRYELETDDPEYEEERKKKQPITNACPEVGPSNSG